MNFRQKKQDWTAFFVIEAEAWLKWNVVTVGLLFSGLLG